MGNSHRPNDESIGADAKRHKQDDERSGLESPRASATDSVNDSVRIESPRNSPVDAIMKEFEQGQHAPGAHPLAPGVYAWLRDLVAQCFQSDEKVK